MSLQLRDPDLLKTECRVGGPWLPVNDGNLRKDKA